MNGILQQALYNLSFASSDPVVQLPDPGLRWNTLGLWCTREIAKFTSPEEAILFAQSQSANGLFESRLSGEALAEHATRQERFLAETFAAYEKHSASFNEPDISDPLSTVIARDRRVSSPLYAHITLFLTVTQRLPKTDLVCEIGGGYGVLARLWLTNTFRPTRTYVIVDLPQSLFFAECYLRTTLGSDNVLYVTDDTAVENIATYRAVLCPVTRLHKLQGLRFDMIQSVLSMQQMPDEYVEFYRGWLARQPADYFYSFNYFLQSIDNLVESTNLYAPRLPDDWSILWSTIPHLDPSAASFANILARPSKIPPPAPKIERPLDPARLPELLDHASRSPDAKFPFALMTAMLADLRYVPKEVAYLCGLCSELEQARPRLWWHQRRMLRRTAQALRARLARTPHNLVPPHLEELKRGITMPAGEPAFARRLGNVG
jgi:putative sugar O-methyltransferase